jgi:hypothetical protein
MANWRCARRPMLSNNAINTTSNSSCNIDGKLSRSASRGSCGEAMYACGDCGLDCICMQCARVCHAQHTVKPCTRQR